MNTVARIIQSSNEYAVVTIRGNVLAICNNYQDAYNIASDHNRDLPK